MKARLVLTVGRRIKGRPRSYTEYRVVARGERVGMIHRRRDLKRGKWPWTARAWLFDGGVVVQYGFARRGDAKRWILKTQDIVVA